jgi:hypothetical protein
LRKSTFVQGKLGKLAVIGGQAEFAVVISGGGSGSVAAGNDVITPLDAIRAR